MNVLNTGGSRIITLLVIIFSIYCFYCLFTVLLSGGKKVKSRFLDEFFKPKLIRIIRPAGNVVVSSVTKIINGGKDVLHSTKIHQNKPTDEIYRKKTRKEVELETQLKNEQNRNDKNFYKDMEKMKKKYGRHINSSESFDSEIPDN